MAVLGVLSGTMTFLDLLRSIFVVEMTKNMGWGSVRTNFCLFLAIITYSPSDPNFLFTPDKTNINNLVKLYEGNFSLLVNDLEILKVLDLKEEKQILNIFNDKYLNLSVSYLLQHLFFYIKILLFKYNQYFLLENLIQNNVQN